jgi:hypothetical protein
VWRDRVLDGEQAIGIKEMALMSPLARLVVCLVAITVNGRGLEPQPRLSGQQASPKTIRAIVRQLQAAVRSDERRTVATLVVFPLAIMKGPLGVTSVPSVAVFMKVYPSVFTARLRDALLKQNPDSVVVRDGTATLAGGRIVVGYRCATADPGSCSTGVTEVTPYKE